MRKMTCEHLQSLKQAILAAGIREDFRGKTWSDHCREWVYHSDFRYPRDGLIP
jgi:hypothetical protein